MTSFIHGNGAMSNHIFNDDPPEYIEVIDEEPIYETVDEGLYSYACPTYIFATEKG